MTNKSRKLNRGYVAITSVVIASVILLAVVATTSSTGYFVRRNVFSTYSKEISQSLAEACVERAMLNIRQTPGYSATNEPVSIGNNTCTIVSYPLLGTIIRTQGVFERATTNLKVTVDPVSLAILSWEEIPNH